MTPEQRKLRARAGAHALHAKHDSKRITEKARAARERARYERLADPDGLLGPEERRRRAEHLRKADEAKRALRASLVESRRQAAEEWRRSGAAG